MKPTQKILRHILLTINYRAGKVLSGMSADYLSFQGPAEIRTPAKIVQHMTDIMHVFMNEFEQQGVVRRLATENIVGDFFESVRITFELVSTKEISIDRATHLIQGPLADVLTHVGQLALIRRIYGQPLEWENYMLPELSDWPNTR